MRSNTESSVLDYFDLTDPFSIDSLIFRGCFFNVLSLFSYVGYSFGSVSLSSARHGNMVQVVRNREEAQDITRVCGARFDSNLCSKKVSKSSGVVLDSVNFRVSLTRRRNYLWC